MYQYHDQAIPLLLFDSSWFYLFKKIKTLIWTKIHKRIDFRKFLKRIVVGGMVNGGW
jgi:hypothetical protein